MIEILSAEQAANLADKYKSDIYQEQKLKVSKLIRESAKKGENVCYYYNRIENNLKEELEDLGYILNTLSQYNEITTRISW